MSRERDDLIARAEATCNEISKRYERMRDQRDMVSALLREVFDKEMSLYPHARSLPSELLDRIFLALS